MQIGEVVNEGWRWAICYDVGGGFVGCHRVMDVRGEGERKEKRDKEPLLVSFAENAKVTYIIHV